MKISISWYTDDVLSRADDNGTPLTIREADEVLSFMEDGHDANIGINWDVIDFYIDLIISKRELGQDEN